MDTTDDLQAALRRLRNLLDDNRSELAHATTTLAEQRHLARLIRQRAEPAEVLKSYLASEHTIPYALQSKAREG